MSTDVQQSVVEAILDQAHDAITDGDLSAARRLVALVETIDSGNRVASALRLVVDGQVVPTLAARRAASERSAPDAVTSDEVVGSPPELIPHEHSHLIEDVLKSVSELSPFSPVAMRLITLLDDELASVDDIARLASTDHVLTARILQAANSAYYRRRARAATIRDAVMLLGHGEVRSLVIGVCVMGTMPPPRCIDRAAFWRYSMAVAVLADLIARAEGDRTGEAFTAGILHNLGLLVLDRYCPQGLDEVTRLVAPGRRRLQDRQLLVFGFTDAELSAALAERWKLPKTVVQAVAEHGERRDDVNDRNRIATALVRARIFTRAQGMSDGLEASPPRDPGSGFLPARVQARLNQIGRWEDFLHVIDGLLATADDASEL